MCCEKYCSKANFFIVISLMEMKWEHYIFIFIRSITSVAYYFSQPPLQAALVNVCWQQRLPWGGRWTWELYVFIYPSICRCQEKGKVIFCFWPRGDTEANDLGHVDCYLAPRIAPAFRGPLQWRGRWCHGRPVGPAHTHLQDSVFTLKHTHNR